MQYGDHPWKQEKQKQTFVLNLRLLVVCVCVCVLLYDDFSIEDYVASNDRITIENDKL
jgi:hypothetical protein